MISTIPSENTQMMYVGARLGITLDVGCLFSIAAASNIYHALRFKETSDLCAYLQFANEQMQAFKLISQKLVVLWNVQVPEFIACWHGFMRYHGSS